MFNDYALVEKSLAQLQLVCFMLGMGANLKVGDFVQVARQPRSFFVALTGQICVVPLLAVAISRLLDLAPAVSLGLILVSAMPGGTISKAFVYLGRGNAALSISLTAVSTLATIVTVPATLRLLAANFVPEDFAMPEGEIIIVVFGYLLLPLAVGMLTGRLWPKHRSVMARWWVRLGFVAVTALVLGSLFAGRINPVEHGFKVPIAIILFCLLGQQLNMVPFYLMPWPRADRLAAGIEVTMRNMNLALLLNVSLFGTGPELSPDVLFVILFYGAVALCAGLPLALNHRRLWRREQASAVVPPAPESPPGAS